MSVIPNRHAWEKILRAIMSEQRITPTRAADVLINDLRRGCLSTTEIALIRDVADLITVGGGLTPLAWANSGTRLSRCFER